MKGHRT